MKKVIALFLIALLGISFYSTYLTFDSNYRDSMRYSVARIAREFTIPSSPVLSDPKLIYASIVRAASASNTNIYRVQSGFTTNGTSKIVVYGLQVENSKIDSKFRLVSGHFLTQKESRSSRYFVSTDSHRSSFRVGLISDFGGNDTIEMRGLISSYDFLPTAGVYYAESVSSEKYKLFLALLAHGLSGNTNTKFLSNSFKSISHSASSTTTNEMLVLASVKYLILLLVLMLLAYAQIFEAKRIGVLSLHGFSPVHVWYAMSGRAIVKIMTISSAVFLVLCFFIPGFTWDFILNFVESASLSIASMLLISLLTTFYIAKTNHSNLIKNKHETNSIYYANLTIKTLSSIALVITFAGLTSQYINAQHEMKILAGWGKTISYGIFYPTRVGNDLAEIQNALPGPTSAEVLDLYPVLNKRGAIYVDAQQYESANLRQNLPKDIFRSIEVNPNYLTKYPIVGVDGKPVLIPDSAINWVLLVPETFRNRQHSIRKFFSEQRNGGHGFQSAGIAERNTFGDVGDRVAIHQHIQIVWVKARQDVFAFNPNVGNGNGGYTTDPIVQVMTIGNSFGVDRENMITGGAGSALKIRLNKNDSKETLRSLGPVLKKLKLSDNLQSLVTMNDYSIGQISYLKQGIADIGAVAVVVSLGLLFLIVQSLSISFQKYSRRIVVRKLFGKPYLNKYQEFITVFLCTFVIQIVVSSFANSANFSPFSTATNSAKVAPQLIVALSAGLGLVEFAISFVGLQIIEKRRLLSVIKGEF